MASTEHPKTKQKFEKLNEDSELIISSNVANSVLYQNFFPSIIKCNDKIMRSHHNFCTGPLCVISFCVVNSFLFLSFFVRSFVLRNFENLTNDAGTIHTKKVVLNV